MVKHGLNSPGSNWDMLNHQRKNEISIVLRIILTAAADSIVLFNGLVFGSLQ
jgi:hypothetical protein